MGMDVYGSKPKNETGEYFRNNVWWWRPLAAYIEDTYPDIAKYCTHWHTNEGDGLNAVQSKILADKIKSDIKSGKVAKYQEDYIKAQENEPKVDCEICNTTGKRAWSQNHFSINDKIKSDPTTEINDLGEYVIPCNACNGLGKVDHWIKHYPFSVENVSEFANFLENCGGFRIC